ncbi:MAG: hypothetical protein EAZ10_08275 [Oscillatoriales cyanobacterium]|nr:MAG: hypothetical protein EAZ10_08275 [Oscillatoriales cyanobacterium]
MLLSHNYGEVSIPPPQKVVLPSAQHQLTQSSLAAFKWMPTASNAWLVRAMGIQDCSDFMLQSTVIFTSSAKN